MSTTKSDRGPDVMVGVTDGWPGLDDWSGPGRALEEHLHLYGRAARNERWLTQNKGRQIPMASFLADADRRRWHTFAKGHMMVTRSGHSADNAASYFMLSEHLMADKATTYYVSAPMGDLVTQAANHPDADVILFPTDLPSRDGLAIMERPWIMLDDRPDAGDYWGYPIPIRAIGWRTMSMGPSGMDDDARAGWRLTEDGLTAETPRYPGIELFLYSDGDSFEAVYMTHAEERHPDTAMDYDRALIPAGGRLGCLDVVAWGFTHHPPDGYDPVTMYARRWTLAFLRLMWQELAAVEDGHVDKAARRRWDRAGRPLPQDGGYKVVHLRRRTRTPDRPAGDDPTTESYRWRLRHRSVTRAHWRRQWYRSLGPARLDDGSTNPDSHRLVWIEAFVRGPEDGPLVLHHNVTAVVR